MTPEAAERRARRLVRCYPRAWRARYGAEFTQLLVDDFSERPRSAGRTLDVLLSALLARLSYAGLAGEALEPRRQIRAGLAALGLALSGFLLTGGALWSQLTIGWQWAAPAAPATRAGMVVMSAAAFALALLALLAAIPLAWAIGCGLLTRRPGLTASAAAVALGAIVLTLGSVQPERPTRAPSPRPGTSPATTSSPTPRR